MEPDGPALDTELGLGRASVIGFRRREARLLVRLPGGGQVVHVPKGVKILTYIDID